ncbi:lactococcin G-beta/enterocin 1071B family bacteriocin [Caldicellulosiruptor changbaiensis]|uniref:lactococcin G-beta/enterocin 1071B family bacteriocin n=1 Tax=Caldicellulosiruptor changbaiensis TaxID=1222016 RepID=UPI0013DF6E84|nr:lactococcin G-beta/enterocin 1071B family bacteriocin [Caldicellulosiruptor changbaiensis]
MLRLANNYNEEKVRGVISEEVLRRYKALVNVNELLEINGGGFLSIFAKGLEIIGVVEAIYEFGKGFIDGFKDGIKVK